MNEQWTATLDDSKRKILRRIKKYKENIKNADPWDQGYTQAYLDIYNLLEGDEEWLDENNEPL